MNGQHGEFPTEGERLQRSGSDIHYWIAGPDDGPLVACTHYYSYSASFMHWER
jgi:3-oxoadipate enol-lactonase